MTDKDSGVQRMEDPEAQLERAFIDEYLRLHGHDPESVRSLPEAQVITLLEGASIYAAGKLAEGKFLYSMVLSDDSVKFPADGTQLSSEAQTRLQDFVQKLKGDNKNVYLEIQGHTDATGPKQVNLKLGEERAEAVRRFMNEQGVALNRMATISYGPDQPVASNKTRAGRAQNRRVVVIVLA